MANSSDVILICNSFLPSFTNVSIEFAVSGFMLLSGYATPSQIKLETFSIVGIPPGSRDVFNRDGLAAFFNKCTFGSNLRSVSFK